MRYAILSIKRLLYCIVLYCIGRIDRQSYVSNNTVFHNGRVLWTVVKRANRWVSDSR